MEIINLAQFLVNSSTTNLILFLLLSFTLVLFSVGKKTKSLKIKLPPGPPPLPLIGNIHQLAAGALPYVAFRDIAIKYGPLMYLKLGQVPTVVVSSAEIAKEILVHKDPIFADRPKRLALDLLWYNYEDMAFTSYSEHWKQLRKISLMELLSKDNVRSFRYIREDEISKITNKIRSNSGNISNLSDLLFEFSSAMTCRTSFGRLFENTEMMIKWSKEGFRLAGGTYLADLFPSFKLLAVITGLKSKLLKMHKDIDFILDDVLIQHKFNHSRGIKANSDTGDEDFLDVLLRHKESGCLNIPISDKHIKAVIFDIFTGGTGTSTATVEWVMSELMRHPKVRVRAQNEVRKVCKGKKEVDEEDIKNMTYIKMVIKETLRLYPVAPILARVCREDCEINGYTIPKNTQVALNVRGIARDPSYWDDPESFKPERFEDGSVNYMGTDLRFFPFGSGRRICSGLEFGVANVEIMVAHLLFHFNWSLPNGMNPKDLNIEEVFGIAMSRKNNLNLVATAYNP